jgi:replication factor A1
MKISDLNINTRKVDLKATVVKKEKPRKVTTRFGATNVANATIEDDTGRFVLVLWGDEVDEVNEGDMVHIENGYVREWNGELQLSAGRFGKISVVSE